MRRQPVMARVDGVVFRIQFMDMNRFYCVEFKGRPYLYRKVSDTEVEVYGLAGRREHQKVST